MKKNYFTSYLFVSSFLLICFFNNLSAQILLLKTILESSVNETSGLFYMNNGIYTHNDSGGEPEIYEIDPVSGNVVRTVRIGNATNVDWEAVTIDDDFIYIGDFGNNLGIRSNLRIYKVNKVDFLTTINDTVTSEIIDFNYSDQTTFLPSPYSTNFDAEAFVSKNDSLYVFTKNWGNLKTYVYSLPAVAGSFTAQKIDSLQVGFLVSDAALSFDTKTIAFVGYDYLLNSRLMTLEKLTIPHFSLALRRVTNLVVSITHSRQTEGIAFISPTKLMISSEIHSSGASSLFELDGLISLGLNEKENMEVQVYPNPTRGEIQIENYNQFKKIDVLDLNGNVLFSKEVVESTNPICIDLNSAAGMYLLVGTGEGRTFRQKINLIE